MCLWRVLLLPVWKTYDVTLTDWTFLEVHQPLLQAVDMENVLTERYFHKFLSLFEVLKAEAALSLRLHIGLRPATTIRFNRIRINLICSVDDFFHNLKVDTNDGFSLVTFCLLLIELAIIPQVLFLSLLLLIS